MRYRRVFCFLLAVSLFFFCCETPAAIFKGEKIVYSISPSGKAEYEDMGLVDYQGKSCWLVTFRTQLSGFRDLEKIYADPRSGMPLIVERHIKWPLSEEFIIEEYDSLGNSLTVRKYNNDDKLLEERKYNSDGPYHNAVLLPFYLRRMNDLEIGWSTVVRLSKIFTVRLDGIEEVKIKDKKITAYHFVSEPHKFEIWISKDRDRLPLLIKGSVGCSMLMQQRSAGEETLN